MYFYVCVCECVFELMFKYSFLFSDLLTISRLDRAHMDLGHGRMGHNRPYTGMGYEYNVLIHAYREHDDMHNLALHCIFLWK